jgi:hypothetical protein
MLSTFHDSSLFMGIYIQESPKRYEVEVFGRFPPVDRDRVVQYVTV